MKKITLFILYLGCLSVVYSQGIITLEECQRLARENYPLVVQKGLIEKTTEYTVSNAKRNLLPQVTLMAQATYQSDVPEFPDNLKGLFQTMGMNLEGLPKDQYKAAVQIDQILWGGGNIKAQTEVAKAESAVSQQNWEVEMYALTERVNQLYFGTLLLQEKSKVLDILIDELNRNYTLIESYKANGVAGQNDLELLKVELLTVRQQKAELISNLEAFRTMLGIMINKPISTGIELSKPENGGIVLVEGSSKRPELDYFDAQERLLDAQLKRVNTTLKPQIGAFIQGAYANVGLNLFEDMQSNQWSPYYIGGIKLQWNILGLYTHKNQRSRIEQTRFSLISQRETFLYNMNLKSTQENLEINRMQKVMQYDEEIITLRESIRKRTEVQIKEGTATVNDLLRDIHSENMARQNKTVHEIECLKNVYDLKYITNN